MILQEVDQLLNKRLNFWVSHVTTITKITNTDKRQFSLSKFLPSN
jgi:hypothetical protein